MAYEENKSESYQSLGGRNRKVSTYEIGDNQVFEIVNFDYSKMGAWTKAPGSSTYINAYFGAPIRGLFEFSRLNGASYLLAVGGSQIANVTQVTTGYTSPGGITSAYSIGGFSTIIQNQSTTSLFTFETFVDRCFMADGATWYKWDGVTVYPVGLTRPFNIEAFETGSSTGGGFDLYNNRYTYNIAYVNDRGFIGPPGTSGTITFVGATTATSKNIALNPFYTPVAQPSNAFYTANGITAIALFRSPPNSTQRFLTTYLPLGWTLFTDNGSTYPLTTIPEPTIQPLAIVPKFQEIYNNYFLISGFTSAQSTVYVSELAEPEGYDAANAFEVRTNDGDVVTGLKSYLSNCIIFKNKSFHELSGDSPPFFLRQKSAQYGCVSDRASAIYDDILLFLDETGVMQYNGSGFKLISTRVEDIFERMNLSAAKQNATMIHNKPRKEIWIGIPIDGSTTNNWTVVYDYVADAWTNFAGFEPAVFTMAKREFGIERAFYGNYTGLISCFDDTCTGHIGVSSNNFTYNIGMTCYVQTRFHQDLGRTYQKEYRRLYLDIDQSYSTPSYIINVGMIPDFGTSAVLGRTMAMAPFQNRIDYGISARSMSYLFSNFGYSSVIRINGYTIESRYLRRV